MINLEAKQEAIKNAYCNNWDKVKDYVDENGWIFWSDKNPIGIYNNRYLEYKEENPNYWRPKSLQGIENNNGWIKIESEADLPKNNDDYWVITNIKDDEVQQLSNLIVIRCLNLEKNIKVTHYKPIEKPLKPIY